MRACLRVLFIFLFFSQPLFAESTLQKQDIQNVMNRLFSYHIEKREMTSQLMRRSLKLYIEQFDPEKAYLLSQEVNPFLQLSEEGLNRAVQQYKQGNFEVFEKLNFVIQRSILRAQKMRKSMKNSLIASDEYQLSPGDFSGYAENENELVFRQKMRMVYFFAYHQKSAGLDTKERKLKAFRLLERKLRQIEFPYLFLTSNGDAMSDLQADRIFTQKILKCMAKSLDAHTAFFTEDEAYEMRMNLEKQFEGIGVVLTESIDGVIVTEIIKGSPADISNQVKINDLVVEINGHSLEDKPFEDVLRLMKSKDQPSLKLGLLRATKIKNVTLNKSPIIMDGERLTYEVEAFGDGYIAKLNLQSFYENGNGINSESDIRKAINEITKKGPIHGIVLDLRDNAGGFLSQAVKVAGLFITSGVVVISKYGHGDVHYLRKIDVRSFYNGPLVILTSKLSASAAEIVAQALQDYGAAIIVGDERTFGKGSIQYQTVTDTNAQVFFKVTVGKYYTVSGKSTQVDGVHADIVVPSALSPFHIGERFLEYPLAPDRIDPAFQDRLSDLDVKTRGWFQKNYLPYLQKRISYWRRMLPLLSTNANYRMDKNRSFQDFLKTSKKENLWKEQKTIYGDLQMRQALEIMKDMIFMEAKTRIDAEKAFSKKRYSQK